MRKIDKLIVHCTDSKWGEIVEVRRWHKLRGFRDIGYHYLICNQFPFYHNLKDDQYDYLFDGRVEKGRDEEIVGAHCRGHNAHSLGICLVGNGLFTSAQLDSLNTLLQALLEKYNLSYSDVYGHYEFNSLKTCPCLDMNKIRIRFSGVVYEPQPIITRRNI